LVRREVVVGCIVCLVGFGAVDGGSVGSVSERVKGIGREEEFTQRSLGSRVRGEGERVRSSSGVGVGSCSSSKPTVEGGRGGKFEVDGGRAGRLESEGGGAGRFEIEGSEADAVTIDDEEECKVGDTKGAKYDASMSSFSSACSELALDSVALKKAVQSANTPRLTPCLLVS
jgi:hypothetical protein